MTASRWLKLAAAIGLVRILLVGVVASQGAKLLLEFPVLIKTVSQLRDPIGPNQTRRLGTGARIRHVGTLRATP